MLTVGIDPGTRKLGWGLVERDANRLRHIAHGIIEPDSRQPLAHRLHRIELELAVVLRRHSPEVGSVETLFFHKDVQAAAKLGHARGVVLLCLARQGIEVVEYAPARVKQTVTGHGRADKRQVALMIRAILGLASPPASDAADALALAVTHLRLGKLPSKLGATRSSRGAISPVEAEVRRQRAARLATP